MSYIKNCLLSSQLFGARFKHVKCWEAEFKLGDLIFLYRVFKKKQNFPSSSKKSNLTCSSWSEFSRKNFFDIFYIKPMKCMQY
jgi:hypothetical protein